MTQKKGAYTPLLPINVTRPISRVLSCAVIYLGVSSPISSSRHYSVSAEQALRYEAPIDVASDRVYMAVQSPALR